MARPAGSGRFSFRIGLVYVAFAIGVVVFHLTGMKPIDTAYILSGWFLSSGLIAIVWGRNRMRTGDKTDGTIGMDTINMLITMLAVAFAIAALGH